MTSCSSYALYAAPYLSWEEKQQTFANWLHITRIYSLKLKRKFYDFSSIKIPPVNLTNVEYLVGKYILAAVSTK